MRPLWAGLFATTLLFAQLPEDHFEVAFKFDRGRLITERSTARISLSVGYKQALRSEFTEALFVKQLCDALDREFRVMPKPYFFTLDNNQKKLDVEHKLNDAEIAKRREWNGTIATFPGLRALLEDRANPSNFDSQLDKVQDRSPIAEYVEKERRLDMPQRFRLRPPLHLRDLDTPTLGTILNREKIIEKLAPLDGLPANPEPIQSILLDFYTARGLTPKIDVKLDTEPRSMSIFEISRVARILLPVELKSFSVAAPIIYESLPDRVFRAFRSKGREFLNAATGEEATKREIDLNELVKAAEDADRSLSFQLPPLDALELALISQRLLPLKQQASLFDFKPEELILDLVIDSTTTQDGSASKSNPATATAETPPNAPETTARPGSTPDLQVSPVVPSRSENPKRSGNTPRREQKNFVGGGFEHLPGQGIRALTTFQRRDGINLFGVEAGGQGSGFSSAHYSRDYLFFDKLGRRLGFDLSGGSDFNSLRVLENVLTDERRSGGAVRLDLEAFRDLNANQLGFFAEGRHETVRLTAAKPETQPRPEVAINLNTIDIGASHHWRQQLSNRPARFHLEPSFRFGLGLSASEPSFRKFRLGARYHLSIAGPVELETRFEGRLASSATPVFELPSLGGPDTVRGFRTDESLGHRLWSSQNELWFPILKGGAPSKFRDFIRRNVRLAGFYDLGGLGHPAAGLQASLEGFRQGAGLGLRVKYQGVVIEADWAYGFGSDKAGRPGRGRFYFNFRLP